MNSAREDIKAKYPGLTVTEIAKKGGELWKELKDKSEWEEKAAKAKEKYQEEMKEWKASGGEAAAKEKKEKGSKTTAKKSAPKKDTKPRAPAVGTYKSKEMISEEDTSSSEDEKKV